MDKCLKAENHSSKNIIKRNLIKGTKNSDKPLVKEKNKIFIKFILKLRNKIKYSLLTFFNCKIIIFIISIINISIYY